MPRFSIITPCRDAAATLPATLASIRGQSRGDWEAILVDDGSTDATQQLLAEAAAADPRIRILSTGGAGPSRARNAAAARARGEILAFLDADDRWPSGKLDRLASHFSNSKGGGDAVYGRVAFTGATELRIGAVSRVRSGALGVSDLICENPVCTTSNLAIRAKPFRALGGFDEAMVHAEDLDLLLRLVGSGGRLEGIDEVLAYYRTSPFGLSADLERMLEGWRQCIARARARGELPDAVALRRAEAIQFRYLARRALRTGAPGSIAARYALAGASRSAAGFFADHRRGLPTFLAALAAPITPRPIRRALYAD